MGALTVVKLGGSLLEDAALRATALDAIAARWLAGESLVVVHGGGKHVDAALSSLGIAKRTAGGLRVTDERTLDVVVSVIAGKVNKLIVSELAKRTVDVVGLSGADGSIVEATMHPPVDGVELGFVGKVEKSEPDSLRALLDAGYLPVVASLGATAEGTVLNVNADAAAAIVATGLGADRLAFFTDVEGFLAPDSAVVPSLPVSQAEELLQHGAVTGGMRPKLEACVSAVRGGVRNVLIAGPAKQWRCLEDGEGGTNLVAA